MTSFNPEYIQSGDGNVAEPIHVGRPGQQVIFSNVNPAESYAAKYPTIESVPADFNGEVDIVTPAYRATVKGDGTTKYITGYSTTEANIPSAAVLGTNVIWYVGANQYTSNGSSIEGLGAISRPYVAAQTAIPMILPPSSTIGANGSLQLGIKEGGGTATFGATSGAGVSCTLSLAGFAGTAVDVGKVITVDGGKQATITAAVSTTVATVTITGTLSGTGPFTDWTLAYPFFTTYTGAYLYFPAAKVYAGSAAGWYYTVMTSTTIGTVYNNIYSSGVALVRPTTPTPIVSAAIGEFTQETVAITALNFTLQGNALGSNGYLDAFIDQTNNAGAGAKISQLNINSTIAHSLSASTNVVNPHKVVLQNRGIATEQKITRSQTTSEGALTTIGTVYLAIDTSVDATLSIVLRHTTATDWVALEGIIFNISAL